MSSTNPEIICDNGVFDPTLEDTEPSNYPQFWLGRSCGARLRLQDDLEPVNDNGIVVYFGKKFKEKVNKAQTIEWVNTANGWLTVVSNTDLS
jgi:hypothetical protein